MRLAARLSRLRGSMEGSLVYMADTIAGAERYFTEFLPRIHGQLLLEDLKTLSVCFEIAVSDGAGAPWRLVVEEGRLVQAGPDEPEPVCRFTLDAGTLLEVVAGHIAPQEAFFDMRIQLEGDIEMGLKLSTVLAPFFQRFPYMP